MSGVNGDKSRHHRIRKQRQRLRERLREAGLVRKNTGGGDTKKSDKGTSTK